MKGAFSSLVGAVCLLSGILVGVFSPEHGAVVCGFVGLFWLVGSLTYLGLSIHDTTD